MKLLQKIYAITIFLFFIIVHSFAQSVYSPLNKEYEHLIDRYEIKSGKIYQNIHTQLKPFQRKDIANLVDTLKKKLTQNLSTIDQFNLNFLHQDNFEWTDSTFQSDSEKSLYKQIYKKKSDFYRYKDSTFDFHLNPVLFLGGGIENNNNERLFINSRGLEMRGIIGNKVGFYTYFTDNQALFPSYITDYMTLNNALPNEGYYKRPIGKNNVDFLTARGYVTFDAIKNVMNVQFGYDKNFIGNGYRSLILSDFSSNYLFLKVNTKVAKRLHYQNIFAQMTADVLNADGRYPQKFMAMHYLSWNISKNFNIGFFENIIFNRYDTLTKQSGGYDLRYLNPIIFYRSIEQQAGSPDNANLGIDWKWNFLKRFSWYGQIFIDEFVLSQLRNRTGWRGNKQGFQTGLKYIDVFGIRNLDLQAEFNYVRPYMYSHNNLYNEYSNYRQPLAHALGANFSEWISIIRYQPLKKLQITAKAFYVNYGANEVNKNWGGNIFLNNSNFVQEFGNRVGQGINTKLLLIDFTASYQFKHNLFLDFKQIFRKVSTENRESLITSLAIRWNIVGRNYDF